MKYMIISAACRCTMNNGEKVVIPCHRHSNFFEIMKVLHCQYDKASVEQGFIDWDTKQERFVSRAEAAKIAIECNQILPHMREEFNPNCCYSEDLW